MYRSSPNVFTRNRKLPFSKAVLFMMSSVKKSLQTELYAFFQAVSKKQKMISNSAFNQARKKINPELFKHFTSVMNTAFYTNNDERVKLWEGFRLLSCDGSTISLPVTEELKKKYGCHSNQFKTDDVIIGRTSVLYDVENEIIIDGTLSPFSVGEHTLAKKQIEYLAKHAFNELLLLDRGYPSFDLIYQLNKKSINYVMRVRTGFSEITKSFSESNLTETKTHIKVGKNVSLLNKLYNRKQTIEVRLVKVKLDNGQTELLMTSLMDENTYPASLFKELYFKRWKIETLYDKLKNKLRIEQFSGYSETSILQDYYCTLFLSNIQSLLVSEANEQLQQQQVSNKKYEYKINTNLSIGFIKNKLVQLFLEESNSEKILYELEELFLKNLIPIRPNRSFDRDTMKYRNRKKPPTTKNFKPTF